MYLLKRGEIFYVEFFDEALGKKRRLSTKQTNREAAINFVSKLHQNKSSKSNHHGVTLSQFKEEYLENKKTVHSKKYIQSIDLAFRVLLEFTGNINLDQVKIQDIERFLNFKQKEAPHAAHLYFRTLKAAFNKALLWEYIETNPFKRIKLPRLVKKIPSFINEDQLTSILAIVDEQILKELYRTAFYTGLRQSELINLKWSHIDFASKSIAVKNTSEFTTKSKKERVIPINNNLFIHLQKLYHSKVSDYCFPNRKGMKFHPDTISHKFKKTVREVHLSDDIHFHSLRHSFASTLAIKGVSLYIIKELLGHEDISTTQIYSHLNKDALIEAVNLLK